jgi:hypothetical protein
MNNLYSNLPTTNSPAKSSTVQAYDASYNQPFEIDASTLSAVKGFFGSRGFDSISSENIAVIIIKQAITDNYNPLAILDTLKGLDAVQISSMVSEILNYNRVKTSFLGYSLAFTPHEETVRNIIA